MDNDNHITEERGGDTSMNEKSGSKSAGTKTRNIVS